MSDEPISQLIVIQDGAEAEAKPLRQNFKYLDDKITSQVNIIAGKENALMKGVANGYCGLDSNGNIPNAQLSAAISSVVSAIYKVGSIYITTSNSDTCPIASLIQNSTWEKVGAGRVLQGADSNHSPNTTIAAGLPDLYGSCELVGVEGVNAWGVFAATAAHDTFNIGHSPSYKVNTFDFYASRSSSIYGNSSTVQPPAYVVNIWRRTS